MLLTVFERLLLRNIVPQIQGWNFGSMKEARILLESLFDETEEARLNFQIKGTQVKWHKQDDSGNPIPQEKEIEISEGLKAKIAKFLKQLDKEERLGFEHYSLYEKFVEEKPAQ